MLYTVARPQDPSRSGDRARLEAGTPKPRLPEVDLLRALALVGVVLIHAGAWVVPAEAPPNQGAAQTAIGLARFCVPAFVFASGFVLFHIYGHQPPRVGSFLCKRWMRVVVPWVACVPVFFVVDLATGSVAPRARAILLWLAYGPGHMYFLVLIAQLYVLFLALQWFCHDAILQRLRWLTGGAVGLQVGLMWWHTYGPPAPGLWDLPANQLAHELWPFSIGTFFLGCLAAAEWPRLAQLARFWPVALLASIAAGVLLVWESGTVPSGAWRQGNGAYVWPARLPQAVIWSVTLLWLGRAFSTRCASIWHYVGSLSKHSLGVYLLHPLVLTAIGAWTVAVPAAPRVLLLVAAALGVTYAAVAILIALPAGALALGETPRPRAPVPPWRTAA